MKRRTRNGMYLSLIALTGLSACFGTAKPPVETTLPVPSLQVHDEAELTQDGLTVSITPISAADAQAHAQIYKRFNLEAMVDETNALGQPTGNKVKRTTQVGSSIVPLPAFKVRIANNTGHVVRFTTAVFRLEDNVGRKYQTFSSTSELAAWLENAVTSAIPAPMIQQQLLTQARGAIGSLQLLTKNVELLKGDEWSGFLLFNLSTGTDPEYKQFMMGIERLKLRLAEIPVEIDDAGNVVRTTEFTFVVDKTSAEVPALCPADEPNPSWEVCQRKK